MYIETFSPSQPLMGFRHIDQTLQCLSMY